MASTLLGVAVLALSVPETASKTRTLVLHHATFTVDVIQKPCRERASYNGQSGMTVALLVLVNRSRRTEDFDPSSYKALRPGAG